jgi:hypothetical protein
MYKKIKENKKERAREARTSSTATPRNDSRGPGVRYNIYINIFIYVYMCKCRERHTPGYIHI